MTSGIRYWVVRRDIQNGAVVYSWATPEGSRIIRANQEQDKQIQSIMHAHWVDKGILLVTPGLDITRFTLDDPEIRRGFEVVWQLMEAVRKGGQFKIDHLAVVAARSLVDDLKAVQESEKEPEVKETRIFVKDETRERYRAYLEQCLAEGRLKVEEFTARMEACMEARFDDDLKALLVNLPDMPSGFRSELEKPDAKVTELVRRSKSYDRHLQMILAMAGMLMSSAAISGMFGDQGLKAQGYDLWVFFVALMMAVGVTIIRARSRNK
jgi:hypothetical protein